MGVREDADSIGEKALRVQNNARTLANCFELQCKGNDLDGAINYHREMQGMYHVLENLDDPVWRLVFGFVQIAEKPMDDQIAQLRARLRTAEKE